VVAKIEVDGQIFEADPGKNLLQTLLTFGFDLPYFCWHPALDSVGACRQCAVTQFRDEKDTRGRLVMACMTPAAEGTRISLRSPEARQFRKTIIETMMMNHPHDCPVCDEGGECHLQDMTVMTGHDYRRYRGKKRTFNNQDLGPLVHHEMNRCIQCYRCTRFYNDYAGGRDFGAFVLRNHVYFGRASEGPLESEFSGNLVEVCPTGVFTDETLRRHYTRKWDLQTAPSVCTACSLGCNTIAGERYGSLRRILNRYHHDVNGYFLCDRGRFGYEFVNDAHRLRTPVLRQGEPPQAVSLNGEQALGRFAQWLGDRARVIGIGSSRASLESNFALRELVGAEHFFSGETETQNQVSALAVEILRTGPAPSASLRDVERSDAVLVLGEDLLNTAPLLGLAVRQSVRQAGKKLASKLRIPLWDDAAVRELDQDSRGPLFLATYTGTKLEEIATEKVTAGPLEIARLGFGIAHRIEAKAPEPSTGETHLSDLADRIAQALLQAERPVIISGVSAGSPEILRAAANVAWSLMARGRSARIAMVFPECNSLGLTLLEPRPISEAQPSLARGEAETIVVLENDLYRRANPEAVEALLRSARHVVVLDQLETRTSQVADLVLPAATFAEGDGTLVNNEGRAQRFLQVFVPQGEVRESWRWLFAARRQADGSDGKPDWNFDEVTDLLSRTLPSFASLPGIAPKADFRVAGAKIPREPHRYSGRTSMYARLSVSEPKPPQDLDTPMSFSMEGFKGEPPPALIARYWSPGWNSVQALNKFQSEVGGPLRGGDPGRRLIEPSPTDRAYFDPPAPTARHPSGTPRICVPLYHIFGSEELSVLSPGIRQLAPSPYLALNRDDATGLGIAEDDVIRIRAAGFELEAQAKTLAGLPAGHVGVPVGLPGLPWPSLPAPLESFSRKPTSGVAK
jgi:NADH-quinone oxidoreductase subunit G